MKNGVHERFTQLGLPQNNGDSISGTIILRRTEAVETLPPFFSWPFIYFSLVNQAQGRLNQAHLWLPLTYLYQVAISLAMAYYKKSLPVS